MVTFKALAALALSTALGAIAAPPYAAGPLADELSELEARQQRIVTQYWANENANLNWTSGPAGEFAVTWDQPRGGNFVVGKGYAGGEMLFNYSGTFVLGSETNTYLGLYGWTVDPLVEYYVIESFGHHNPSDNSNSTCYGTFESDGGVYEVWMKWRLNAPSIVGTADFPQYWSVRTRNHVGGTIDTGRHFEAWEAAGLPLGRQRNMYIGIEGQWGNGAATITAGVGPTGTVEETMTPTTRSNRPMATSTCLGEL